MSTGAKSGMSHSMRSGARKYVSGFDRLAGLPPVFTLNTLVRATGMNRASAKVALTRWAGKRWVERAGPRAGIYFNHAAKQGPAQISTPSNALGNAAGNQGRGEAAGLSHAVKALVMKYPSATLRGASVLHSAGWTTQIPSTLHVAIEARRSYAKIDGVTLFARPVAWFQFMQAQQAWVGAAGKKPSDDIATYGLRALAPAWALADLCADKSGQSWQPDEDDVDVPKKVLATLRRACNTMNCAPGWLSAPAH